MLTTARRSFPCRWPSRCPEGRRALAAASVLGGLLSAPAVAMAAEPYCEGNPAVIYCNDFESGALDGIEAGPAATVVAAADGAPVHGGGYSLHADFTPPYNAQAEFGVRFAGVERVYLRFYVRFDSSWDEPMHHWYAIHGDHPADDWSCHGDAGCRPNGLVCLSGTTVDSREVDDGQLPGEPFFYTYHPDMSCDQEATCANYNDPQAVCDGCASKGLPCESGLECCWGNWFDLNQGVPVSMVQDTWYEIETMVAANTPGMADGEMALWIDGVLVAEHSGIAWRETDELLLNHVIVWNYYPQVQSSRSIWFDELVISTQPIGSAGGGDDGTGSGDGGPADGSSGAGVEGGDTSSVTAASAGPTGGDGSGSGSTGPAGGDGGGESGCGCRGGSSGGTAGLLPLLLLASGRRRSRHCTQQRG
ncbi:hypothetical protein [Paraliomyxa miuraensis]|uniref:hypothetical protein n=1 Tax=Paraliomyxa miuraensis TaxID=376150 RepID=UPI00224FFF36|nr:hypothetical protein [Paraliomyxa miuraensis]MCX4241981.1 hypothetical protein [Paraliomyxa miuraensis]